MKVVLSLLALCFAISEVDAARPNVFLFIADDLTWRDCQPYGNNEVNTPHLAKLASQGMKFNACFTSTAMCAPTRAQLYTGMFPVRNGAYPNHSAVRKGTKSLPHHFKSLGYRVALIGKTHFKPASSFPFEMLRGKGASDTTRISEFVNRDKEQPYCLVVASKQPHSPWTVGPQEKYDSEKLTIPTYLEDTPATRKTLAQYYAEIEYLDGQVGACMNVVEESGQTDDTIFAFTSEQGSALPFAKWTCYDLGLKTGLIVRWPGHIEAGSENSAMVQYVDVLPTLLEAAGAAPNKIDTGRPGAPNGGSGFDGSSFLDVLLGKKNSHHEFVFGAHTTRGIINGSMSYPIRSVRSRSLKFIQNLSHESAFTNVNTRNGGGGVWQSWIDSDGSTHVRAQFYTNRPAEELYDLAKDPYELHNVITEPAYAAQVEELRNQLTDWMKQQNDRGAETEALAGQRKNPGGKPRKKPEPKKEKKNAGQTQTTQ